MLINQKLSQQIWAKKQRKYQGMRFSILHILLVLIFFSGTSSAFAANYYVAKNGNNSGPGTEAQPWLTVQHAANQVAAGDTVHVKAGTYHERVVLKRSGSAAGGYITFKNFSGDKPILDGSSFGSGNMVYGINVSYMKFQGFHIKNYKGGGIYLGGEASHLEIRNNELSNQTFTQPGNGHAIWVNAYHYPAGWPNVIFTKITDLIIDNNYIHDVQTGFDNGFDEALTISYDISRFQITNNLLERVSYIGIDCIGKGPSWLSAIPHGNVFPHEGIIAHNVVRDSGHDGADTGIYLDGAKNIVIEKNQVYNMTGHGIVTSTEAPTFTTENIIVRYNELWNNMRNLSPGSTYHGMSESIRAVHNVLYSNKPNSRNIALMKGDDVIVKNNISHNITGNFHVEHYFGAESYPFINFNNHYPSNVFFQYKGAYYNSFHLWQAAGFGPNSINSDPRFVSLANKDFHLQPNSAAIDAGDFLTKTTSGGSGTTIPVEDPLYFSDGFGMVAGDLVQIGSNQPANIMNVDLNAKRITVDRSIAWSAGDGVSYPYTGSAPDMGVYEQASASAQDTESPETPTGLTILN